MTFSRLTQYLGYMLDAPLPRKLYAPSDINILIGSLVAGNMSTMQGCYSLVELLTSTSSISHLELIYVWTLESGDLTFGCEALSLLNGGNSPWESLAVLPVSLLSRCKS